MGRVKITIIAIFVLVALFALSFGSEHLGLWWNKYFGTRRRDVQREVYEESKSYVHGKIQDLAKYYREYNDPATTPQEKKALESVLRSQFADMTADNIREDDLRRFLVKIRGY